MKKLLAIALGTVIMFSSLTARVCAISPDTLQAETIKVEEAENGRLTMEFLEQMSSWEELVNTVLPISDIIRNDTENEEDIYCLMLIEGINKKLTAHIYHNEEYVSLGLGGINLEEIDYCRFLRKCQEIIDIYNAYNDLELVWEPQILNEKYMQIDVKSTTAIDMSNPATQMGQKVVIKHDSIYWESAWHDGNGKYGIAADTNGYIPENSIVTVNGVAYYSDESRADIVGIYYKPYDELGEQGVDIVSWKIRMLHVCTETTDLGWVYPEDVVRCE